MRSMKVSLLSTAVALASSVVVSQASAASNFSEAFKEGDAYGALRLRYEGAEQDNPLKDASALTLRTMLGFKTAEVNGISGVIQFEDVRAVLGQEDYNSSQNGKGNEYSLILDPDTTELDQAYVQFKNKSVTAKLGRQIITLDDHRFVGTVGWRQDWQTYDAFRTEITPSDKVKIDLSYIYKRNRILAQAADAKSSDVLANVSFKTPVGKVVTYAYLLDDETLSTELDTFGASLNGKKGGDVKFLYSLEYATQSVAKAAVDADVDYFKWNAGAVFSGITVKVGQEIFGREDGANFVTPLATLHKFNGWTDVTLLGLFDPIGRLSDTGLEDTSFGVSGKVGPGKFLVRYHDFAAYSGELDDLGSEIEAQYVFKVAKAYTVGLKFADYSADNFGIDTQRVWAWVATKF